MSMAESWLSLSENAGQVVVIASLKSTAGAMINLEITAQVSVLITNLNFS